ncbi:exonuclease SbcCD subunit D C-terminal domain-containing protein [Texcoconibacillus texcoconensis]|uniref:exonuclease SbcCD subunit D C-terminal domain-containing protein n=1 Tax=Texcoconibacillus texcoconensis TaxID=1095777 RepID=UPI0016186977
MRLLHTADWHLGRTLEGRDRLPEHEAFIDELVTIARDEDVDAVLIAGDIYDSVNPPAASEALFYESLARLSEGGKRPIVIISGNHDHPDRLAAAQKLAEAQEITIVGTPSLTPVRIPIRAKDTVLNVAPLAYPSESRLNECLSDQGEEELILEAYDERVRRMFQQMSASFSEKEVNVAMSHLFVAGGKATESERPIEVGGTYTVRATSMPENVQYVALGHLHRPQEVKHAPTPTRYSGSPLAFSFSEAGYSKSVTIVDVEPGKPAETKDIPLSSGFPLVRWKATDGLPQIHQWMDEGRDKQAWIDIELHTDHSPSMEDIHQLRKAYPGIVTIRPVFPEDETREKVVSSRDVPIDELFRQFYSRQTGGSKPEDELVDLFLDIVNETETEEGD